MELTTKTVYLSNFYPQVSTNNSSLSTILPVSIESGTKIVFDLSQVENEFQSNNLGVYKTVFKYGDGLEETVNSQFINNSFSFPQTVSHNYFLSSFSSPTTGNVAFFYKNGKVFNIVLSAYFNFDNNIDLGLILASNNSFVSLSADTLVNFTDKENNLYNTIVQNSKIADLEINIPKIVTALSTFPLVTTSPIYGDRLVLSALDTRSEGYSGFEIYATRFVQYVELSDGTIENVRIIDGLPGEIEL